MGFFVVICDKKRLYIVVPVVFIALMSIIQSATFAVADIQAYKARYLLSQWEKEQRLPTETEVVYALNKVSSALNWAPSNTEYMDLKAHVLTYQGLLYWGKVSFVGLTDEAVGLYLRSTEIRPKWPYAWARLALLKAHRGEFDELYLQALLRANEYGPWEPNVQKTVVDAGLYGWDKLDKVTRMSLVETIQRGLSFQFKAMDVIVSRHKRKAFVCGYFKVNKKTSRFCGW